MSHPDFFGEVSSMYPGATIARWVTGDSADPVDIAEFLCREPITMRHLKKDISRWERSGAIKVLSTTVIRHEVIILAIGGLRRGGSAGARPERRGSARSDRGGDDPIDVLSKYRSLALMPVSYQEGWATLRVIVLDEPSIPKMLQELEELGDVKVTARLPMKTIPVDQSLMLPTGELFSGITDKQARSLITAVSLGYFRVPRKTRFEDLSAIVGTPRTTFETHVRKAEAKVLTRLAPYLSVHFKQAKVASDEPRLPRILRPPRRAISSQMTTAPYYASSKESTSMESATMSDEFFKAIKEGDVKRVTRMVERNHDLPSARSSEGMSAVTVACYWGQPKIADLLVSKGAVLNLFEASMAGRLDQVKRLAAQKTAKVDTFSEDGFTALHLAAFFGQPEVAKFLIARGADVNVVAKNGMKVTPLHSAAARNHVDVSRLLLEHGAKVNAREEGGFTPLHAAAQNGSVEMARLLLKHGADPELKTDDGKTPLILTREEGQEAGPREKRRAVSRVLSDAKR